MDIEDLSKSQLLLLTILVNFVVAIATAVMTVSLLDQAPTTVTQTVNRIVDHTIETVTTQVPAIGTATPSTEELLTSAIAATAGRSVLLMNQGDEGIVTGLFVPTARAVVTVSSVDAPRSAKVRFADGSVVAATRTAEADGLAVYIFAADAVLPQAVAAKLTASTDLKQGQTAIALSGEGSAVTGIITKIDAQSISADLPGVPAGSGIVNISGDIIGIGTGAGTYIPAERILAILTPTP